MEYTIRPVTPDELIETVHIYLECIREDYAFKPQAHLDEKNPADELAECQDWLYASGSPNQVFGAFVDGKMVGYIAVGPNTGEPQGYEGEVCGFFIQRDYRNFGIGLKLLQNGLNYLRALGYQKVIIYNYNISAANQYYRRLGGEVVYRTIQSPGGMDLETDVFAWEIERFLEILAGRLKKYEVTA